MRPKHSNISVFIPHLGCPQSCSFCNQRVISGQQSAPSAHEVDRICSEALLSSKDAENTEIAFFGGSFTAIDRGYMTELLETAFKYVGEGKFRGIRVSTRPDCIDREILSVLKSYGVTSIELGAQSMDDDVLCANDRGHTSEDVRNASALIKESGFELGLQIIPGLYKSTMQKEEKTVSEIIKIRPETIRIYPIVVLRGTRLAELYLKGEYKLISFDDMVRLCADMIVSFEKKGIRVIKCGLHASDGVSGDRVAGYYHPAFRELCGGLIFRRKIQRAVSGMTGQVHICVSSSCVSKAIGHKRENIEYFRKKGIELKVSADGNVCGEDVLIKG